MVPGLNSEPGRGRIAAAFPFDRPLQTTWPKTCFLRQAYAAFVVPRGIINRKSCGIYGERKIHNADGENYNHSPDGFGSPDSSRHSRAILAKRFPSVYYNFSSRSTGNRHADVKLDIRQATSLTLEQHLLHLPATI